MSTPAIEDPWLVVAKRIDYFRVVPRLVMTIYFAFFITAWLEVFRWFAGFNWQSLPNDQVVGAVAVAAVAGFPTIILGSLTNILYKLVDILERAARANKGET